ncbi:FAD/NAD(P)-binding protein [Streptomyces sp. NPDC005017]|uniref:FAD/NAD(P)-binding protein n=1 Tax=Streptomyces sp. NPDC005017 TaxID=3364706 RepID=UPI003673C17D
MANRDVELAVIGGGAAAVCLLDALAEAETPAGRINVFEPTPHLWRGRPYQHDDEVVRLNSPVGDMSVRHSDPLHFERWLAARDRADGVTGGQVDPYSGVRFVPRTVYGTYLEHSARRSMRDLAAQGGQVNVVRERVVGTGPALHGGAVLVTDRGRRLSADYVVLCVGRGAPQDTYQLNGAAGFVPDPYPVSKALVGIGPQDAVGVIGSGLTAVDAVLALAAVGHRGPISLLSRQGVLPAVRQRPVSHRLRHFTAERFRGGGARRSVGLATAARVLGRELAQVGEDLRVLTAEIAALGREDPTARLRRQLDEVDSGSLALRIAQSAVPEAGPGLWSLLADEQKAELLRSHYRTIHALCCPMAPASAATLLGLMDSGQLRIVEGLRRISPSPGGGFAADTDTRRLYVDHVVNAVNAPVDRLPPAARPLIDELVTAGVAARNPFGGLSVERESSRLVVKGEPNPHFHVLGDLAFGTFFFTFGIPAMVNRAQEIAASLRDHMPGRTPVLSSPGGRVPSGHIASVRPPSTEVSS